MATPEDPRDLARRLAAEAKARMLAKKLVDDAKARLTTEAAPAVASGAPAAPAKPKAPLSALEAMRLALEEERQEAVAPAAPAPAPTAAPARPAARVAAPAPAADPRDLIARRLPTFELVDLLPVAQRDTFRALWTAHRVRAATEGDVRTLVTADVLLDAAARVPEGALFGAHVRRGSSEHAIFLDAATGVLLGMTDQPELFLAGL